LLEVENLTPAFIVADRCAKAAGVEIIGIESADGPPQCIKLRGDAAAVQAAGAAGAALAAQMGSRATLVLLPGPTEDTQSLADQPPAFVPLLGLYDARVKKETTMKNHDALGLLETQGLAAALHATDEMLKSAAVKLVGKEKIGAAYVTIMVRGDVAAVQAAIAAGRATVERLGGKLILADVIPRPHPELAALLPA
jgi:ethanolamine utilization protein EutM